jgi:EAL domain-containing protein (putative c-di-GMP-specific phosphodiesterase class I)
MFADARRWERFPHDDTSEPDDPADRVPRKMNPMTELLDTDKATDKATDTAAADTAATDTAATDTAATRVQPESAEMSREYLEALRDELIELIQGTGPSIAYESIVHVQSGEEVGAEALARFPGRLTTGEWFKFAHAVGIGDDLELRVIYEVLREQQSQAVTRDSQRRIIGINVSPKVFVDPRFLELIRKFGDDHIVIELTEQTTAPTIAKLRAQIAEVRAQGVDVAIHVSSFDDEALRVLLVAEPSMVKLGVALTTALADGEIDSAHARSFFARCRRAGVIIVAVGVERTEQLRALEPLGVDAYQGYLTGRRS